MVKKGDKTNWELAARTMISGTEADQRVHNQAISVGVGGHRADIEWNAEATCVWVWERKSRTATMAGELADVQVQERKREIKAEPTGNEALPHLW